jgi:hypothetical protein
MQQDKQQSKNPKDPLGVSGLIVINLIAALCTAVAVSTANTFNLGGWPKHVVIVAIDFALSLSALLLYSRGVAKRAETPQ